MNRRPHRPGRFASLFTTLLLGAAAQAVEPSQPELIATPLAKEVARRTIELVEANALRPRDQDEYTQAKGKLLATLDAAAGQTDRGALYEHINAVLGTLDVDRHSFIIPPTTKQPFQQVRQAAPAAAAPVLSFSSIATARGKVLHWTPPQSVGTIDVDAPAFLKRFTADASADPALSGACALVVDLSAQRGGNAWPPFIAMHPLLSDGNTAAMVSRDGIRERYVHPQLLAQLERQHGGEFRNPLLRFAGMPFAVVVGKDTSSAGEMLLVALMGEGARVRSFGSTSHGMTTANKTYPMSDGSTLVLTERRYAVGDAPVIRGGIPVEVPVAVGDPAGAAVRQAAEWAAAQSPLCLSPSSAAAH